MSSAQIRATIRANEEGIYEREAIIRKLNEELGELEALRGKFSKLQTDFESRQNQRRSSLSALSVNHFGSSIAPRYYEGMKNLIDGNEFRNADAGLSEAKNRIYRKMRDIENEINEHRARIQYLESRNSYWRSELVRAAAMEQEG